MLSVEELAKQQEGSGPTEIPMGVETGEVFEVGELSEEEQGKAHFYDSELEHLATLMKGEMFEYFFETDEATIRIVASLKRAWESGGWLVGVMNRQTALHMILVKPRISAAGIFSTRTTEVSLAARGEHKETSVASTQRALRMGTPLLLRMPTRGRPDQALRVLSAYREMAAGPVAIEVVIDHDDPTTNNSTFLKQLYDLDCMVAVGAHKNKIAAVNGGTFDDWAIMALISDDMAPIVRGYDERITAAMAKHFPLLDGAIYFDDGYNKQHSKTGQPVLCTLPIFGRHLYEDFGYVYHPDYGSLYSDNEQTDLLTAMKRLVFVDENIIEHRHHAAGKAPCDALYRFNDETYGGADKELYLKRASFLHRIVGSQFAFDSPPLMLSMLICSTTERAENLRKLVAHLRQQMRRFPRQVEICVAIDEGGDGAMSIGQKRQSLLERAVGHYVAFIDDDDWVSHDYVEKVLTALTARPDCVSLHGIITTDGQNPQRFHHSMGYAAWYTGADGLHRRTPNHLNAVKRELAIQAGFPSKNFGEDHDYSKRLHPLLKTEQAVDTVLYHYWYRSKK